MVDLVKLRKKAKEKKDAGKAPEPEAPVATADPVIPIAEPVIPSAVEREESGRGDSSPSSRLGMTPEPSKLARFLASAGQAQSTVAAQAAGPATDEAELLTFTIAGELYAVDIENIAEIVTPRRVTRVPNADRSIVGIFSLRGTIVTLIDVRSRLGHPRKQEASADSRVVVARLGNDSVGFIVDRVQRVVNVPLAAIEPQPVVHTSEQDDSVRGVFRHGGALTILLDLEKLLAAGDHHPAASRAS